MRIAVIGSRGQLGSDLCKLIPKRDLVALAHKDIEITDINSVERALVEHKPDAVINTAAYVRVDDCETNVDTAYQVNALGARNVAVISQKIGAKLVYISTDYVFGGDTSRKVPYTEYDKPDPLNVYGKSKLAGEDYVRSFHHKHFIIRASGLFGTAGSSGKGGNFVETILKLAKEKDRLTIVADQVFSPTYTADLAARILEIIPTRNFGIFHVTNSGACSWFKFAREILSISGINTPVDPIDSDHYPQKAKRSSYSVLENYQLKLLGSHELRNWKEAIKDYLRGKL